MLVYIICKTLVLWTNSWQIYKITDNGMHGLTSKHNSKSIMHLTNKESQRNPVSLNLNTYIIYVYTTSELQIILL